MRRPMKNLVVWGTKALVVVVVVVAATVSSASTPTAAEEASPSVYNSVSPSGSPPYHSELTDDGNVLDDYTSPLPYLYLDPKVLPEAFSWGDVGGISYLTRSLNQHLPQYCGSCWAHAALSSLADRIKIARHSTGGGGGRGPDIQLSVQYVLNCGTVTAVGTCGGGSVAKTYGFLLERTSGFVPYETCQPYLGCSVNSTGGICPYVDTSCTPRNICRTCDAFREDGGSCTEIDAIPNATVAEFGTYLRDAVGVGMDDDSGDSGSSIVPLVKAEIFARGPVVATLNGHGLGEYVGGIYSNATESRNHTHAVSITGWGREEETGQEFWIVRNSWGEYWGEMGFFRIAMHQNILGIEDKAIWATPGTFTTVNYPCFEDGSNCGPVNQTYVDPSKDMDAIRRRLKLYSTTAQEAMV